MLLGVKLQKMDMMDWLFIDKNEVGHNIEYTENKSIFLRLSLRQCNSQGLGQGAVTFLLYIL